MTLQNFPEHFTHTITTTIEADADGRPWTVTIKNFGGLSDAVLFDIAMEALNNWEGSCRPRYDLIFKEQLEDDVKSYSVTSLFG